MNIQIYSPRKKSTNIQTNEYICLDIFEYPNIRPTLVQHVRLSLFFSLCKSRKFLKTKTNSFNSFFYVVQVCFASLLAPNSAVSCFPSSSLSYYIQLYDISICCICVTTHMPYIFIFPYFRCQREGWVKLSFYLLTFFYYLYG